MRHILVFMLAVAGINTPSVAQDHQHGDHQHGDHPHGDHQHGDHQHGDQSAASDNPTTSKPAPPTVFLDKSPRVVEYQLKRLDNQRLLQVERSTNDAKYIPVYQAILSRIGMSPQFREEALAALMRLQEVDAVNVLLEAIGKFDSQNRDETKTAHQLAGMLLGQPAAMLQSQCEAVAASTEDKSPLVRAVAFAGLVMAEREDEALRRSSRSDDASLAFLNSIELIPDPKKRASLRAQVVELLAPSSDGAVRRAAAYAIGFIRDDASESFELLAPLFDDAALRNEAVRTLLKIPSKDRDNRTGAGLVTRLVEYAENTPAEDRTSQDFIDAMQLADQLLAKVPSSEAKAFRQRLDAVTVRVVRIKTVAEEMRYDLPHFAVQAGKAVQIVLENHDLMPHNLVITVPGALKEVAQLGLEAGPSGGGTGLPYVPASEKVLFASELVPADQQTRMTFDAPSEPGEYPYVCTFPQHWYRMYGVMVVVEDLDEYFKNPTDPANPIGSNRKFVQAWTLSDLRDELDAGMRGRTPEFGKRIFSEASCAGCHKVQGEGGVIGPDLTDVVTRWKGDRVSVLREILDPSHKVDEKYLMQKILTVDGQTITGILVASDDETITLLSSPEAKAPIELAQDDIEAMVPSSVSMMPKALMDQYTKDEIFEMLAYLESVNPQPK